MVMRCPVGEEEGFPLLPKFAIEKEVDQGRHFKEGKGGVGHVSSGKWFKEKQA